MKNIFLLPTDKPSRLLYFGTSKELTLQVNSATFRVFERSPQNIYITSDEEIKDVNWRYDVELNRIEKGKESGVFKNWKKIILTTDQDLIKDGVQAIDDEFLEWFIKNPSCDFVEVVEKLKYFNLDELRERSIKGLPHIYSEKIGYKIIIPSEELKQETEHLLATETNKKRLLEDVSKQETLEEIVEKLSYEDAKKLDTFLNGMKYQEKIKQEDYALLKIELSHTKMLLASCEKALEERDKQQKIMHSNDEVYNILWQHTCELFKAEPQTLDEFFNKYKKEMI
jgi:hypothetical protein